MFRNTSLVLIVCCFPLPAVGQRAVAAGPNVWVSMQRGAIVQVEPVVAANPNEPSRLIVAAIGLRRPHASDWQDHQTILVYQSGDGGRPWSPRKMAPLPDGRADALPRELGGGPSGSRGPVGRSPSVSLRGGDARDIAGGGGRCGPDRDARLGRRITRHAPSAGRGPSESRWRGRAPWRRPHCVVLQYAEWTDGAVPAGVRRGLGGG